MKIRILLGVILAALTFLMVGCGDKTDKTGKSKKSASVKKTTKKIQRFKVITLVNRAPVEIVLQRKDCLPSCVSWSESPNNIKLPPFRGGTPAQVKQHADITACEAHIDLTAKYLILQPAVATSDTSKQSYLGLTCVRALGGCAFSPHNFPIVYDGKKIHFSVSMDPQQKAFSGVFQ